MQIQLCEDDGDFHGGIPQLVVLVVQFDDGKTKRIPYPAEKSIATLYQDLRAIAPQVAQEPQKDLAMVDIKSEHIEALKQALPLVHAKGKAAVEVLKSAMAVKEDKSNIIEKEDIVTLVKLNPRDLQFSGTISPLVVGMDYRVIAILGPKIPTPDGKGIRQIIQGLEVIDDNAPTPERMIVTPDEVQLKSKRLSVIIEKVSGVEEILPCPACQVKNSLRLDGSNFKGTCDNKECGVPISIARVITSCKNTSCKDQKVSCFDVGNHYEGKCGNCKATIEVPHA